MLSTTFKGRRGLVIAVAFAMATAIFTFAVTTAEPANAAYPGGNGWVAYEEGGDLWVVAADGLTPPVNLTNSVTTTVDNPSFSPDGTQIAYSSDHGAAGANIWIADFNSVTPSLESHATATKVTTGGTDEEPSWSPDGSMIVFERRASWTLAGAATAPNATGVTLTDAAATFITDGVVAGTSVTNTSQAWTGTVDDVVSETELTITPPAAVTWVATDTYTIAIEKRVLYKVPAVASGTVVPLSDEITLPTYNDSAPVWSPTNTKIAFQSDRELDPGPITNIYTMNTNGTGQASITDDFAFDDHALRPAWSPDGLRIAFHADEPNGVNGTNIWTVDASDGGNAVNVTGTATAGDRDRSAAYSPDGTKIVFQRKAQASTARNLAVIDVDGSGGLANLTTPVAPRADHQPNWQPILVGVDDAYAVDEDDTIAVPAVGVLANDKLLTGTNTASVVSGVSNGSLTLNANGSFSYTHDGSETTADSFTYRPVNGSVNGTIATVTITINPINDAPIAVDDGPFNADVSGELTVAAPGVLSNDTDPEGGDLTAVLETDVSNGTLVLDADGSFTYTHDGTATKTDSFTYQAKDTGNKLSNVATVSLTIGKGPIHGTGLVDMSQGRWYLYDTDGVQVTSFFYGNPGDVPFMGDWDGDGIETPGLYRQSDGFVYIKNTNAQGNADITFFFGNPGDVPIAGDFNGDGFDTVSIYRPGNQRFYIINALGKNGGGLGAAEFVYTFGNPGDKPFVGDFNGDGMETVGLHRESTGLVYYRNEHSSGNAQNEFLFGNPGDRLIAGDWTGDRVFTPALYRPTSTTMFFKHTNSQGNADDQFVPTPANSTWVPVSGVTGF